MSLIFEPEFPRSLPIFGCAERFPLRRVFCIGRNYAAHAREMGHDPDREPPFFFTKAGDDVVPAAEGRCAVDYPPMTEDLHFEVEMVAALGAGGMDIAVSSALDLVFGYGVGIDLTRRDLQAEAKKLGRPWDVAKSFAGAAPCSGLRRAAEIGHPTRGAITLDLDGERRQTGDLLQMIWPVAEQIAHLSRFFVLMPGDLIFTGTPAGVGPVERGGHLRAEVEGVNVLEVDIV